MEEPALLARRPTCLEGQTGWPLSMVVLVCLATWGLGWELAVAAAGGRCGTESQGGSSHRSC